jgi:molecular chaperone DnaK (HSP70)
LELDKRFIIGIDLGTTNSAVSYVDLRVEDESQQSIRLYGVPQLTGHGEISRLDTLPSFLYIPGKYDLPDDSMAHPWQKKKKNFAGAFARDHGAKVPARLVSSAKSWLCHGRVDKKAPILPWGSPEEVRKVSPVEATAAYLEHIRLAWNNRREDEEDFLENQFIIITVPASFDEVARDLTVEAAQMAGLPHVTLLEEPLAAFYAWLMKHEKNWSAMVTPGELILVCDVGGGTTDFTLITLREVAGSPRFERIAVGDHLILGGDNVDLALARGVEATFGHKSKNLSGDDWKALCHQCRRAKERILDGEAEKEKITIMGTGSRLIAGTFSSSLDRDMIAQTVIEGFFPLVQSAPTNRKPDQSNVSEFGLPYEPESAITAHLGSFLERHSDDVVKILQKKRPIPDLILFNGGSLKPELIQERIREAIRYWFDCEKQADFPRVMENSRPDLSVALGASYYGLVKAGRGVRVGSGSARGYYLGIAEGQTERSTAPRAICVVERGLEEGSHITLEDQAFEVLANQPVRFDIYSSSFRSGDRCGDIIGVDDSLTELPPIQTIIQYGRKGELRRIPIQIQADFTEIGTLALWCASTISDHRWQLQFQLRTSQVPAEVSEGETLDQAIIEKAGGALRRAFDKQAGDMPLQRLVKEIGTIVGLQDKASWPFGLIRSLCDDMIAVADARKIRPAAESRWLNLMGFCLRPGFGDAFDSIRLKTLWKVYNQGPVFANNPQVRAEWWIMWRRVAGGLKPGQQRQFIQNVIPSLIPKKGTKVKINPQERINLWMAAANMEKLMPKDKTSLGRSLLKEIRPKKSKAQQFWALSRLGARNLLYGSDDRVIPPKEVAAWIQTLLEKKWPNPRTVAITLAQLARKTGDRMRDIEPALAEGIIAWMQANQIPRKHQRVIEEVIAFDEKETAEIFGDELPSGIILKE